MHQEITDYDNISTPATKQAIDPLLNSLGNLKQSRILELASGSGHLAKQAITREAMVTGIDLDPDMVKVARERVPSENANFIRGNVESLPFENESFHAVLCSFGFPHFPSPESVLSEVARVLKPGGICSFTVWQNPDKGNDFFRLIFGAFKAHVKISSKPSSSPSLFTLADPKIHIPLLTQEGFTYISSQVLNISWPLKGKETVFEFILKGSQKTRALYDLLPVEIQQNLCETLTDETLQYLNNNKTAIPCPALLISARKAG